MQDYRKNARIHLYTGDGEGKTTTALGLTMRAIGHNHKVVIVQFMKAWKNTGEYKIRKQLRNYEIYATGRNDETKGWINLKNPSETDRKCAQKALELVNRIIKRKNKNRPGLLILDEINLAAAIGLVKVSDILKITKKAPKNMVIVLTGRRAPQQLIRTADLVTYMKDIKHPFKKGATAIEGIEY